MDRDPGPGVVDYRCKGRTYQGHGGVDIRLADMTSKRRPENIAFPRQIAMYLTRQMTESSLNTIGEAYGGRDHGTVLHACRLVKDRMEVDANVRQVVHYLEKQLMR